MEFGFFNIIEKSWKKNPKNKEENLKNKQINTDY